MKPDPIHQGRHLLQVLAFCLAISALQYFVTPNRPYQVPLVYSLCIGVSTWALIDLGRFVVGVDPETGWPPGWRAWPLVILGTFGGYVTGTAMADQWFGWSSWTNAAEWRSSAIVSTVAGAVICGYFYYRGKSAVLEARARQARSDATEAQLRLLQAQLDPHMLFNTLANLRALVASDATRAQQMLDHLIPYLRTTLSATRAVEHPLKTEFERLDDYLALMAVRMGPRLSYELNLPADLENAWVPTLLLQPLVENAIRHGLEPQIAGGRIDVRAWRNATPTGDELWLQVVDDGVGLPDPMNPPPERQAPSERGYGLDHVRDRLVTLLGESAGFELRPGPGGGTLALLHLPLRQPQAQRASTLQDMP